MGFRELPLFNKALLGKQGWWLLTRPEALCTRVMKGKYFPNTDFLAATRKRRSYETWKAIVYGQVVLKMGVVKRVGPGNSINISEDNWIQGLIRSLKPRVRKPEAFALTVDELFLPGSRMWTEHLIRNSFIRLDAEEFLKIKPGNRLHEDVLAWAFERGGQYSVRSAYIFLKEEQQLKLASKSSEGASSSSCGVWWKVLWKMKIPPKIRIFWW
ncbi:Alanyl-tRNA synthetase [Panicum miliaceum]|uniref:Alanyl-tRNA synthetase n=1 Tax=Panicum miliaceum TaxID=4540 RepID=A0A3L6PKD1_PANMI|nr:Alanyl-tRNA synthetase [Panicum miliaceum]